jgi:hypothetical protein
VHETFDALLDFDEGAVGHEVDHLAAIPWRRPGYFSSILSQGLELSLLEAEGDALLVAVHLDDHHLDFLALLHHLARVRDAAPAHVGDVEQAVQPSRSMNAP